MAERVTGLPAALARRPMQTMRPRDAARVYAHPRPQLKRLVERGVMHRLARGHYVVVPPAARPGWKPTIEAAAAGVATARFGQDDIVLMGRADAEKLERLAAQQNLRAALVRAQRWAAE